MGVIELGDALGDIITDAGCVTQFRRATCGQFQNAVHAACTLLAFLCLGGQLTLGGDGTGVEAGAECLSQLDRGDVLALDVGDETFETTGDLVVSLAHEDFVFGEAYSLRDAKSAAGEDAITVAILGDCDGFDAAVATHGLEARTFKGQADV